ncbi:MAG TPA: squalene synthase HpnC [Gammaproteobacteria bacterium]|nr:squalene synthase HpnC [Gammaproteobacteria bacterium]
MSTRTTAIRQGYHWCRTLARAHYENFPVASRFLPGRLRDPVAAIYAFARSADDIADEGDAGAEERLQQLDEMAAALRAIEAGTPPDTPLYQALADTIGRHRLPLGLFHDLLSAFRQDVEKKHYADFGEVMDYCRRSANPVGRLLLLLTGQAQERNLAMSDALCSALQLINFLQDLGQDYHRHGRIYLPRDELQRFKVNAADIEHQRSSPQLRMLLTYQAQRASRLLRAGSPLGKAIRGRFGLEVRAIVLGGARMLEKLEQREDLFSRPRLDAMDRWRIVLGAIRNTL